VAPASEWQAVISGMPRRGTTCLQRKPGSQVVTTREAVAGPAVAAPAAAA